MIGTVEKRLELPAAPERVWRAITAGEELSRWFPDRVDGGDLVVGADGGWVWENHGRYAFRVEVMEPPTRLVWRWAREPDTALEDAATTTVEWLLEPGADGGTTVRLRESGFLRPEDRSENDAGWDAELGELQALLAD
jgi:uncharacterized protein YndB with AHSA1/START domain